MRTLVALIAVVFVVSVIWRFAARRESLAIDRFLHYHPLELDPVLDFWEKNPSKSLYGYPAGTWGPREADGLFPEKDLTWRYPCKNLTDEDLYCEI